MYSGTTDLSLEKFGKYQMKNMLNDKFSMVFGFLYY